MQVGQGWLGAVREDSRPNRYSPGARKFKFRRSKKALSSRVTKRKPELVLAFEARAMKVEKLSTA